MHFYIMTLFPEMVMQGLNTSIIGRAMDKGILSIDAVNIRDYAFNKHNSVDDYPYGGGAGMLMPRRADTRQGGRKSQGNEKAEGYLPLSPGQDV